MNDGSRTEVHKRKKVGDLATTERGGQMTTIKECCATTDTTVSRKTQQGNIRKNDSSLSRKTSINDVATKEEKMASMKMTIDGITFEGKIDELIEMKKKIQEKTW